MLDLIGRQLIYVKIWGGKIDMKHVKPFLIML